MQNLIHFLARLYPLLRKKATNPTSRFTDMFRFEMTVKGETVDPKNHLKFPTKDIQDSENQGQVESETQSSTENA